MRMIIGFSQKIRRSWMDALLDHLVQTTDIRELRSFLDDRLHEELPGKESRAKAAGILLRVWGSVPEKHLSLRRQAIALLPHITGQERIWLHWGMSVLAYPFFRDVAEVVGRILMLQDDFTGAQVQTRLLTTWGDRSTTREAAQKLLNTFVDWGVLRSPKTKGHFLLARKWTTHHTPLQLWLLEALLAASSADEIEAQHLVRVPESFPFMLGIGIGELRKHPQFSIHRQGLDMDMVSWRVETLQSQPKLKKRKPIKAPKPIPAQSSLFDDQQFNFVAGNGKSFSKENENPVATLKPGSIFPGETRTDTQEKYRSLNEPIGEEMLDSLPEDISRVQRTRITLENPFVDQVQECVNLLRDGYYYGCISLSQTIIESLVHRAWQVNFRKKKLQKSNFEKNVEALDKAGFLSDGVKANLNKMSLLLHEFHQLKALVEGDNDKLKSLAQNYLQLLSKLEQLFCSYSINEDEFLPTHSELWSVPNNKEEDSIQE